jgi:hypothetical protein
MSTNDVLTQVDGLVRKFDGLSRLVDGVVSRIAPRMSVAACPPEGSQVISSWCTTTKCGMYVYLRTYEFLYNGEEYYCCSCPC